MAFRAVFHKCGFKTGFYSGDAAFIDIGLFLFPAGAFDIKIEKFLAIHNGHAQLFWLSCVDQHAFHIVLISY